MLSYELCKKLKDAGFPQKGTVELKHSCPHWAVKSDMFPDGDFSRSCDCWKPYEPTLSELIEACKEDQIVIWKWIGEKDGEKCKEWYAGLYNFGSPRYIDDYPEPKAEGDTPEEAVAFLFISLNAKKDE